MNEKKPTYITLFSSAGIGCYGFKMNGFECIATNELLNSRMSIQKANNRCKYKTGYINGDITTSEIKQKLFDEIKFWEKKEKISQVDVVFATPPCQGMSTVNYKKKDTEQIRNSLVIEAINIIKQIQPKIFIFENVRAFMTTICTDLDGKDKSIGESIFKNLSSNYNISYKVINFKDYGVPSSRPRTIVIGTCKSIKSLSPLLLFPSRHKEITLREAIGDLPSLDYGEKDDNDFLHFARTYPKEQLNWIKCLKEGQSAFNQPINLQPGYINDKGEKIINKGAYMGNKYRRLVWDKVCSCIHTRNDILSSQDTIHPSDNRVLSIRELMRVMTIPDSFIWTNNDAAISVNCVDKYLKENELNIRRCIGEAVPTLIVQNMAKKIIIALSSETIIQGPNPADIFHEIIKLKSDKSVVKIRVEDTLTFITYIPQLASYFSEKTSIETYCVDFNEKNLQDIKDTIKKWDLFDFVSVLSVCSEIKRKIACHFLLRNNMIEPLNVDLQPNLFADEY